MRPKIGIFSFTGCSGCQLETIVHQEDIFLDLVSQVRIMHFPIVQQKSDVEDLDIAFVEGSITTRKQAQDIVRIRENSKIVVAIGACACIGGINSIRNKFDDKKVAKSVYGGPCPIPSIKASGIDKYIKVDVYVQGCPPVKEEFTRIVKQLLIGIKPTVHNQPVCAECRMQENHCLLTEGKLCLGPMTVGGCGAMCPSHGEVCDGCRGFTADASVTAMKEAMQCQKIPLPELKRLVTLFNTGKVKI